MSPLIHVTYKCEKCLHELSNQLVWLAAERVQLLTCPNLECELSGQVRVMLPASLSAPAPTRLAEFVIPGSMAYLADKKRRQNPYAGERNFEVRL